jgi:hypothetical protein
MATNYLRSDYEAITDRMAVSEMVGFPPNSIYYVYSGSGSDNYDGKSRQRRWRRSVPRLTSVPPARAT